MIPMSRVGADPEVSSQGNAIPAVAGHSPAAVPPTTLKVAAVAQLPFSAHDPVPIKVEAEKPAHAEQEAVPSPVLNQEMDDEQQEELFVDAEGIRETLCAQVQEDAHLDGDLSTELANGSRLDCSCIRGYPDGDAVITNSAGGRIDLKFSKGQPHGKALQKFQDGKKIEFEFKHGRREGKAIETLPNGQTTMFSYRNGKRYKSIMDTF